MPQRTKREGEGRQYSRRDSNLKQWVGEGEREREIERERERPRRFLRRADAVSMH